MQSVVLAHQADWDGWRKAARAMAGAGVDPGDVVWSVGEASDLFAEAPEVASPDAPAFSVPRKLVELAELVIQANDPERFALLYALLWRNLHGERHLLDLATDRQVQRARMLGQAVSRDTHKMRAFLRFREVAEGGATRYVAWFEPDHYIVEANAAFFVRRFATMQWSILTPYRSAHWDGVAIRFDVGADPAQLPDDDALEAYWRTYYSSIFNPARLKIGAMTSEMPRKYWKNLPEARAIPDLIRGAQRRVEDMVERPVISLERPTRRVRPADPAPEPGSLAAIAAEAALCRNCKLHAPATQTVFGEGRADAVMMLIGEQPGDQEDLAGRPFVGPAGQLLDRALAEAGVPRDALYVTNAVKHFKFEPRGKRRIHQKPDNAEIMACRPWLDLERAHVRPRLTVLLGATAARAVLGRAVTISRERGRPIALPDPPGAPPGLNQQALITVHPSYLLRLPDQDARAREYASFVGDLRLAGALIKAQN